jgi:hypothetical protein
MLNEIAEAIESLQNPSNRAEVNISVANQFNLSHQPDRAFPYIEEALKEVSLMSVEEKFDINDLRCKAAKQLAKVGLQDRSLVILSEALSQADLFDDSDNRDYALIAVSETYAEIGLYERAIQIGSMIEDEYRRIWRLFDSIAHIVVEHSAHEQVLNVLAVLDDNYDREHFLLEVANTYSARNQPERAVSLVSLMTCPSNKAEALAKAVKRRSEVASLNQLLDLLAQAEVHAFSEQDISMKAQALRMIAEQHIELKQFSYARLLLEQAKQYAISLSATHLLAQVPRDFILSGIAMMFGKLAEYKSASQTTDAMTSRTLSASALAEISQKNSVQEKLDDTLRTKTIQELFDAENSLLGNDSHAADLQRVILAEGWSKLTFFERVQSIAEQINDPNLKDLALRYSGFGMSESQYDRFEHLSKVCESASKQSNFDEGQKILIQMLKQIYFFEEGYKCSLLIKIVDTYFNLIRIYPNTF